MGCGCCSVRCWLIVALTLTLLFTAIRQGLDSWGRLYLCIIMNFLHILMTVVGLFGVGQLRTKLLLVFLIWWPFWLTWNSFVFSYYQNFGILSRDSKILSLGEGETLTDVDPKVDGIGSRWLWILVQLKVGFRKYWWIEVGFAVLQIALSLICGLLALIFLLKRRNKRVESPDISRRNSNQPRITLQLADVNFRPSVATTASTNNGYTSDTTGYLNASFDDSPSGYHTRNGKLPDSFNMGSTQDSQQNGTAVGPNYRRSNSERTRSRNGTESSRSKRHHNGVDRPNDTLMLARSQDDQQTPVKVRHNSLEKETKRKSTKDRRNSYSGRSKGRPESTGETTSMNKTGDLALVIDDQRQQSHRKKSDGDDLRRSSRSNENSRRSSSHRKTRKSEESVTGSSRQQQQSSSFRHIPTGNLQRLSHPGAESSGSDVPADSPVSSNDGNVFKPPLPVHTRHQATPVKIPKPPAYRKSSNTDETLEVVTYNQEPKRNSALSNSTYINCPVSLSPSGVTGGDNSARQRNLVKSQISSATSNESIPPALVSFDPKSNTLLRYHQTVASATTYGYTTASRATTSICSDLELVEQPALPTGNQFEGIPVRSAVHNGTNNNSRFNSGNDHMRLRNEQLIATRDRVESVNSYDSGLPGSTGVSQRTSLPPSEGHNLGKIQNLNGVVRAPPPYSNYRELPPASITMNNRLLYGAVRQQQNQEEPHSGSDTFNDNWSTSSYATSNAAQVQTQPPPISRPQIVSGGETSGSKTQNDISNFLAKYYGEDVADGRSEASMYQPYQEKITAVGTNYGVNSSQSVTPTSSAMASLFGNVQAIKAGSLLV